jgi:AcrR family transcriptional regulator
MASVGTAPAVPAGPAVPHEARRQRADAQRNVTALLEAAKTVFLRTGVDAPAKEITDLAGLGVGTLYRHFPKRSDLVVAVMEREIGDCAAAATSLAADHQPWDALMIWVDRLVDLVGTKRGLAAALHSGDPAFDELPGYIMSRLEPALDGLLAAARAEGILRETMTSRDLVLVIALMCQPVPGEDVSFNDRMIQVFLRGLRHA